MYHSEDLSDTEMLTFLILTFFTLRKHRDVLVMFCYLQTVRALCSGIFMNCTLQQHEYEITEGQVRLPNIPRMFVGTNEQDDTAFHDIICFHGKKDDNEHINF